MDGGRSGAPSRRRRPRRCRRVRSDRLSTAVLAAGDARGASGWVRRTRMRAIMPQGLLITIISCVLSRWAPRTRIHALRVPAGSRSLSGSGVIGTSAPVLDSYVLVLPTRRSQLERSSTKANLAVIRGPSHSPRDGDAGNFNWVLSPCHTPHAIRARYFQREHISLSLST